MIYDEMLRKAQGVDIQHGQSLVGHDLGDAAIALDLGVVTHAA